MSQTIAGASSFLAWDISEGLPLVLSDGASYYVYGPGGLPIEQISSGGAVLYLHHDQQGSTRMLTGTTGVVEGTFSYSAYGGLSASTGAATSPLGYDAQYGNPDTGLTYLRARSYDPASGQFTTPDPMLKLPANRTRTRATTPSTSRTPAARTRTATAWGATSRWVP